MKNQEHIVIEKGVQIPDVQGVGRQSRWPAVVAKMQFGDSVTFPSAMRATGLSNAIRRAGFAAVTRTMPDKSVRVWKMPSDYNKGGEPSLSQYVNGLNEALLRKEA